MARFVKKLVRVRRTFCHRFKAKMAIMAIRNDTRLKETARKYHITPAQLSRWKQKLITESDKVF